MPNPQSPPQCPNIPPSSPASPGGRSPRPIPNPMASSPPPPSSSSSSSALLSRSDHTNPSTGPTKIPFRPRKTRKLAAAKPETDDPMDGAIVAAAPQGRSAYRLPPRPLSAPGEVAAAMAHLRAADPHLAQIIDAHQVPMFQNQHPPFHALTRSILHQQLAFKAAASIYSRFLALCGGEDGVVPQVVLGLSAHQLRQIGVSARKASYLHDLANKFRSGILSDASIAGMDDKSLFTMLNMVKGIGAWSVHMFMIFSLHRPDVLPVGDVGVRKGVQLLYGLEALPRPSQMEQLCEPWKPYRSVGAWYMWRLGEAKGMPAALAAAASGGDHLLCPQPLGSGNSSALQHLHRQPSLLPHQHQHPHPQQHQHQRQLQMQAPLVDVIHSIPNLG